MTSASLTLFITSATSAESAAYSVHGEYYASANWPLDSTDWLAWPASASAFSVVITSLTTNANNTIALSNVSSIVKGGLTGFRMWGPTAPGAPVGSQTLDVMYFNTQEAASNRPSLEVTYVLGGPKVIVVSQ